MDSVIFVKYVITPLVIATSGMKVVGPLNIILAFATALGLSLLVLGLFFLCYYLWDRRK